MAPEKVLKFWFEECKSEQWFKEKSDAFDALIKSKFEKAYWAIVRGETAHWRKTPRGRLAEILVLDQFSRNMFRGAPQAFAADMLALAKAQEMVLRKDDLKLSKIERRFLYLPYEHSESKKVHREALRLFKKLGDKEAIWYERDHKKVIDRFGRYPSRNAILGRESTPQEIEFLKSHKGW